MKTESVGEKGREREAERKGEEEELNENKEKIKRWKLYIDDLTYFACYII
jgi:hypothetical protein